MFFLQSLFPQMKKTLYENKFTTNEIPYEKNCMRLPFIFVKKYECIKDQQDNTRVQLKPFLKPVRDKNNKFR